MLVFSPRSRPLFVKVEEMTLLLAILALSGFVFSQQPSLMREVDYNGRHISSNPATITTESGRRIGTSLFQTNGGKSGAEHIFAFGKIREDWFGGLSVNLMGSESGGQTFKYNSYSFLSGYRTKPIAEYQPLVGLSLNLLREKAFFVPERSRRSVTLSVGAELPPGGYGEGELYLIFSDIFSNRTNDRNVFQSHTDLHLRSRHWQERVHVQIVKDLWNFPDYDSRILRAWVFDVISLEFRPWQWVGITAETTRNDLSLFGLRLIKKTGNRLLPGLQFYLKAGHQEPRGFHWDSGLSLIF